MKKVIGNKLKKQRPLVLMPLLIGVISVFFCIWLFFSPQGKFSVRMITIPPDPLTGIVDYRFEVKTLDGLHIRTYDFGRYYGDNKLHKNNNFVAFSPNFPLSVEEVSQNSENGEIILAIRGRTFDDFPVLSLVSYFNGEFRSIPYYNGSRQREIYFSAQEILLKNLDEDPESEIILGIFLTSEDGSAYTWDKTRLDYNAEMKAYLQTSTTHEPSLE